MINLKQDKKNNYLKANLTLCFVSFGFFISYPFHTSFAGGLISSGCSAGMIGGLADWFAVNALFRKPIGISPGKVIRTEIIPRNRERIVDALVEMVQNELLHKENLKNKLSQYNLANVLIKYLIEHDGQKELEKLLVTLIQDIFEKLDPLVIKNSIDKLIEEGLNNFKLAPFLVNTIDFSLKRNYLEPLLNFLSEILKLILNHPQVNQVLILLIQKAFDDYEGDNATRKLVSSFLPSSVVLAGIIQEKLISSLDDPVIHSRLKNYLIQFSSELEINPSLQEKVERIKVKIIHNFNLQGIILKFLSDTAKNLHVKNAVLELWVHKFLDNTIHSFIGKSSLQGDFDRLIKTKLTEWIDNKHDKIGRIVRDSLNNLSNDMLIKLIETKAGNDLQMIRINGSIVGGLAGILIYLITYLIS